MLGCEDLVVTASSLGHPPFRELAEAAAAGGFQGLSIWPGMTYQPARDAGLRPAEMRQILADHGLVVNDVDALMVWVGPDEPSSHGSTEAEMFEAAEALGAHFMNVVLIGAGSFSHEEGAEVLAGVCDRARQRGLVVSLEFIPFMGVPDATSAWNIVRAAGRDNLGLMVDTWHCFRGPTTDEDLRKIPGHSIRAVQINDAPAEPMDDLLTETLHHRRVPGEGDIDLAGFMSMLREGDSPAPLTAEVFSDALLAQYTPAEAAHQLGEAMRRLQGASFDE